MTGDDGSILSRGTSDTARSFVLLSLSSRVCRRDTPAVACPADFDAIVVGAAPLGWTAGPRLV
jgi:hypothetical protein